jgi:hypothetical protein
VSVPAKTKNYVRVIPKIGQHRCSKKGTRLSYISKQTLNFKILGVDCACLQIDEAKLKQNYLPCQDLFQVLSRFAVKLT